MTLMSSDTYAPAPGSIAETLVNIIRQHHSPIRTAELAALAGIDTDNVSGNLTAAIRNGIISCCKIELPGHKRTVKEYRWGPGIAPRGISKSYQSPKPTIIPVRPPEAPVIGNDEDKPIGQRLKEAINRKTPQPIWPPQSKAQPEVAHSNTGSDPQMNASSPAAVAVAATVTREATPKPRVVTRELGRATPQASAGNDLGVSLDQDGSIVISTPEDVIELTPDQTRALGDFLALTEGIWRP